MSASSTAALPAADRAIVARLLTAYGEDLAASGAAQLGDAFTDVPEADALVKADPNAFLIGVLFTQGVPAERAWAGPWSLSQRLGHLDLARIAADPEAVRAAFAAPPCLHRFKRTLAGWVTAAAVKLLGEYGGDASRIWPDGAHVLDVSQRLSAFPGIGRKKAAMAVEILRRHFGVRLTGVECGSVAYDVHVRRVFLRSGLAEEDSPECVEAAAAAVCPASPGVLDLPAWLVGREWCRPSRPLCSECPLGQGCAKRVSLSPAGVGVRR